MGCGKESREFLWLLRRWEVWVVWVVLVFFFFFLNLRGVKICIRKKLLGFGWIPLDPGNRQWKRRVGAITVQAEKMELQQRGLGACFMEWDTCHQELHCVKHSARSEHQRNWSRNGLRSMWQMGTEKTGICNYNYLLYCWINFWPMKKTGSVWCPFSRTLTCVRKYFREEMGSN